MYLSMHASFFLFLFLSFFLLLSTLSLFHNLRLKLREMKASMAMSELPNPASTTPVNKSARQSRRKKKTNGRTKEIQCTRRQNQTRQSTNRPAETNFILHYWNAHEAHTRSFFFCPANVLVFLSQNDVMRVKDSYSNGSKALFVFGEGGGVKTESKTEMHRPSSPNRVGDGYHS